MEAMNIEERKSAKWKFSIIFAVTLLIIALCGSISIVTAQKAIALLENKKIGIRRSIQETGGTQFPD